MTEISFDGHKVAPEWSLCVKSEKESFRESENQDIEVAS